MAEPATLTGLVSYVVNLASSNIFVLMFIFIIFIFSVKRVIGMLITMTWLTIAGAAFPFAVNHFLGYSLATDLNSIIMWSLLAIGVYMAYSAIKLMYKVLVIGGKIASLAISPFKRKKHKNDKEN